MFTYVLTGGAALALSRCAYDNPASKLLHLPESLLHIITGLMG
jgi:hypothetical protein